MVRPDHCSLRGGVDAASYPAPAAPTSEVAQTLVTATPTPALVAAANRLIEISAVVVERGGLTHPGRGNRQRELA